MTISTNIDGSVGGANQLLDLLSVVSNPGMYEAKLKALQDATAENQKFVELVAPASEILKLRDDLRNEKASAEAATVKAKEDAFAVVEEAKSNASSIIDEAKQTAAKLLSDADAANQAAVAKLSDAQAKEAAASNAQAATEKLGEQAKTLAEKLEKAISEQQEAKAAYDAAKAEVIAKHQAFIESL